MAVVAIVGLTLGNYAFKDNALRAPHSYGFPPPLWGTLLWVAAATAIESALIGLAIVAGRAVLRRGRPGTG